MKKTHKERFVMSCFLIIVSLLLVKATEPTNNEKNLAYPEEIAQWDESTKAKQRIAGEEMISALKSAIASGDGIFKIEPGNYRLSEEFLKSPVIFENASDIEINADSSTIWIEKPHGLVFEFRNASNVKIRGLTIDYDPLPFTQGTILELHPSEKALTIDIDNGFPSPMDAQIYAATNKFKARVFILKPDGIMRENVRDDWVGDFQDLGNGKFKVIMDGGYNFFNDYSKYQPYKTGDKIVIPVRAGALFSIQESESVSFEDCNIYASCGMGFISRYGKGKHVFDKVNIIPRPGTGRLLSAVADGIHSYNSETGPEIKNCRIENLGDDAVAIHGFFGIAFQNTSSSKIIDVTNPFEYNYQKGMKLELMDFRSLEWFDSARIESVEIISGLEAETRIENLRATLEAEGNRVRSFPWKSIYRITLNKPITIPNDALVVNEEYVSGGFKVLNNNLRNIITRGILIKSANGIISGNTTNHTGHSGITLYSEAQYWLEGPFSKNIIVEENRVENACISLNARLKPGEKGAVSVEVDKDTDFSGKYLCDNIIIRNNSIHNSGTSGISVNASRNITIKDNLIDNPVCLEPFKNSRHNGIFIGCCDQYLLMNNTVDNAFPWMDKPVAISPCAVNTVKDGSQPGYALIYPNPSDNTFTALLPNRYFSLKIFNINGKNIFHKDDNFHLVEVNSTGFPPGIFSIVFETEDQKIHRKKLIIYH